MSEVTWLDEFKDWLAGVCWRGYIRLMWGGREEDYRRAFIREVAHFEPELLRKMLAEDEWTGPGGLKGMSDDLEKEIWINPDDPRGYYALSRLGRYTCKYILDDGRIEALEQENARLRRAANCVYLHAYGVACNKCGFVPAEEVKG